MERNWRKLSLINGETLYVDASFVVMLEPIGDNTNALLASGVEVLVAGGIGVADSALGELRLRGVNGYRINPDHVIAVEGLSATECRLHLSTGLLLEAHGISASDLGRAIRRQDKYPWDTIRLIRAT